jgi:hypothetical protein
MRGLRAAVYLELLAMICKQIPGVRNEILLIKRELNERFSSFLTAIQTSNHAPNPKQNERALATATIWDRLFKAKAIVEHLTAD